MLGDLVYIFFASFFSAGIAEFLNWLLIYRTDEYQRLKNETEKLQKKRIGYTLHFWTNLIQSR